MKPVELSPPSSHGIQINGPGLWLLGNLTTSGAIGKSSVLVWLPSQWES